MSDLETFAPIPRIVTLNSGLRVEILPLRLGQMPAFTKAVQPIAGSIFGADYLSILNYHPQSAIDVLLAYGLKAENVQRLFQDEVTRLISAIYEVNNDFFIQRLRPEMTKAAAGAIAAIKTMVEIGEASSPGSPETEPTSPPA